MHCSIQEPRKIPSSKWYSHKTNGPALTYQVILSVREQRVLSVIGPYPAGESDLRVLRKEDGILNKIPPGKRIIADRGYNGERDKIATPNDHDTLVTSHFKDRARARQETFNARLKVFNVLDRPFRHLSKSNLEEDYSLNEHKRVFESVSIMVQYDLQYRGLFDI